MAGLCCAHPVQQPGWLVWVRTTCALALFDEHVWCHPSKQWYLCGRHIVLGWHLLQLVCSRCTHAWVGGSTQHSSRRVG